MLNALKQVPVFAWVVLGAVLALLGVFIGLLVASGSPAVPAASSVLTSDGYTPTTAFQSVPPAIEADYGSGISSWAIGTKGSSLEMVVTGTNADADLSHVQAFLGGDISVTASGDVMRVDGPQLAFEGSAW